MNFAPQLSKRLGLRRSRVLRACLAFALITLLATANSIQAGPVRINQVVQTLSTFQGPTELKLVTSTQDPASSTPRTSTTNGSRADTPAVSQVSSDPKLDALLSGFPIVSDQQKLGVEIVEEGEVEGTICDCGELLVPGGFPKWPLLFLTAVPLIFIDGDEENPTPTPTPTPPVTPTPTPTPTPPAVPEPASLLLFGTGLIAVGAGLRRRYAKTRVAGKRNDGENKK